MIGRERLWPVSAKVEIPENSHSILGCGEEQLPGTGDEVLGFVGYTLLCVTSAVCIAEPPVVHTRYSCHGSAHSPI